MANRKQITASLGYILIACFTILACREGHHRGHSPTAPPDVIIGSGNVVRQTRPISGVDGVKLIGVGNVELEQSGSESLIVEAEDNLLEYLTTEIVGGTLVISQDPNVSIQATRRIVFHVGVPTLNNAELLGAGSIKCSNLTGDRLELASVGVGSLDFSNLSLDELDVSVSGVGASRISGTARKQHVVITGVGSYEARDLDTSEAHVELMSVGSATVRVRERLVAYVAGTGCLYYLGNPVLETSSIGNGCIRRID